MGEQVKPKPIEAWAVVGPHEIEEAWASRDEAERHARSLTVRDPDDYRVVRLVEANPRERAVVRAASAYFRKPCIGMLLRLEDAMKRLKPKATKGWVTK
jgi:hypothetical protein